MKFCYLLLVFFFLIMTACNKQISVIQFNEVQFADLVNYKMKILPESPGPNDDVRLIVYDDCNYNVLKGIKRDGNTIDIEKQYNSMMKLPCMLRNDTISIGKLAVGTYKVNYRLVDLSTQTNEQNTFAISFKLLVAN